MGCITANDSKFYIGICETNFKTRWHNHNTSFKYVQKRKQTALSNHVWNLKDCGIKPIIRWSILKKPSPTLTLLSGANYAYGKNISLLPPTNHPVSTADQNSSVNAVTLINTS